MEVTCKSSWGHVNTPPSADCSKRRRVNRAGYLGLLALVLWSVGPCRATGSDAAADTAAFMDQLSELAVNYGRHPAQLLRPERLTDVYFTAVSDIPGDGGLVAVGIRGVIALKGSGLQDWRQVPGPVDTHLTSVVFVSSRTGWITGAEGTLMRSDDAGRSWQVVRADPQSDAPLFKVWFHTQDIGFALGGYGRLLRTTDGGDTWTEVELVTEDFFSPHLFDIDEIAPGVLMIAGEKGAVFRSSDAGKSWQEVTSPFIGSLFGLAPLADDLTITYGITGHIFQSNDMGTTWSSVDVQLEDSLFDDTVLQDGSIIVAGHDGTLLHLTKAPDGALSATLMDQGLSRENIMGIATLSGQQKGLELATNFGLRAISLDSR